MDEDFEMTLRQVGGVLSNHPDKRLLAHAICELTGLSQLTVYGALFVLHTRGIVSRRYFAPTGKKFESFIGWKIRPKTARQMPLTSSAGVLFGDSQAETCRPNGGFI